MAEVNTESEVVKDNNATATAATANTATANGTAPQININTNYPGGPGANNSPIMVSPVSTGPGGANVFHKSPSLYVGDLNQDVTETVLFDHFRKVASVVSVRVCRNLATKRSMGYAYVNFTSLPDAQKAMDELNYSPIKGRACRIMWSNRNPTLRKNNKSNIFIKNLDETIDNKQLHDTFSMFGAILSCKVATDRSGKSKGYGFVHYENETSADEAIKRVNGMKINEKEVYVSRFQKQKRKTLEWTNLYVKNIPEGWDEDKLKEIFKQYGVVTSVILKSTEDENKATFGFVDMETHEEAKAAIEALHGKYELAEDAVISNYTTIRTNRKNQSSQQDGADNGANKEKAEDGEATTNDATATTEEGGEKDAEKTTDDSTGTTDAVEDTSNKRYLIVSRAQRKADREREMRERIENQKLERLNKFQGRNLYVKNLSESVTDDILRKAFNDHGTISSAKVMTGKSGKNKGFGFVCFSSADEASKALNEMNGKSLEGKQLFVSIAQPKPTRRRQMQNQFMGQGMMQGHMGRGMPRNMMNPMMQQMNPMGMNQMYAQMYQMYQPGMMGAQGMMNMAAMGRGQPQMQMNMPRGGYGYAQMMQMPRGTMMMQQQNGGQGPTTMSHGGRGPRGNRRQNNGYSKNQRNSNQNRRQQNGQRGGNQQQMHQVQQQQMSQAAKQQMLQQKKLTAAMLANASPAQQKNMIGEQLYPRINQIVPKFAGKVTGMLLEAMETAELLNLLEDKGELEKKTREAVAVLNAHSETE